MMGAVDEEVLMLVIFVASYHCRINSFSVFQLFDGLRYIISLDLSILSLLMRQWS